MEEKGVGHCEGGSDWSLSNGCGQYLLQPVQQGLGAL